MRICVAAIGLVSLVGACKSQKQDATPATSSATPTSTAELDALWALAPEGATAGVVIAPGAVALLENTAIEFQKVAATVPQAAHVLAEMESTLEEAFGTKNARLADAGMTPTRGAAFFFVKDDPVLMILPVVDRDKFLRVANGTKGRVDTFEDTTCKQLSSGYACAKDATYLDKLGGADLTDMRALAGVRGDIEGVGTVVEDDVQFGVALQLERGAVTLRGALKGLVKPGLFPSAVKPRLAGDNTAGFASLNLASLLAAAPPIDLAPGVTLDALARSVSGPITLTIGAGDTMADMRVPLSDVSVAQKLISQCDQLPPLRRLAPTVENGVCRIDFPQVQMAIEWWIDGTTMRIGRRDAKSANVAVPMTALGREIAAGAWTFALWGRGSVLATPPLPPLPLPALPPQALLGLRSVIGLNELGMAMRAEGDSVRFIVGVRTAWSNPDDLLRKLAAIPPEDLLNGKASETGKAIADASPKTPFAADYKAGFGGVLSIAAGAGIVGAVAIPAFIEYRHKAKTSEASVQLRRLETRLKAYFVENGTFPKGSVAATPQGSCCDDPNHKCFDPSAWQHPVWQALDFELDEPHIYRYGYESDGQTATVRAVRDLDCDGTEAASTMVITGSAGNTTTVFREPPPGSD